MSGQGDENMNEEAPIDGEMVRRLDFDNVSRDLVSVSEQFKIKLEELRTLYAQDEYNDYGDKEALLSDESLTLHQAQKLIEEIKGKKGDNLLETSSRLSRHSRRSRSSSCTSTSSSAARIKALAEAAAARESAEFERVKAEIEHERRKREAEAERMREQERAQHERELAILAANRKVAIANAKLNAIEQAIEEEENGGKLEIIGVPKAKSEERTLNWVRLTTDTEIPPTVPKRINTPQQNNPERTPEVWPRESRTPNNRHENGGETPHTQSRSFATSTPINITGNQLIETLTSTNQQIVAGLARQNLPKCHPDTFNGDPTLFHPWKAAFKAMIEDANVSRSKRSITYAVLRSEKRKSWSTITGSENNATPTRY